MRKLFNGTIVPTEIKTDERIFKVITYDGDEVLCNLNMAHELIQDCAKLQHYWNGKFTQFGKSDLKEMFQAQNP